MRGCGGRRGDRWRLDLGFSVVLYAPVHSWQLEEVKASERSLRARLRTVNTELAVYKRG